MPRYFFSTFDGSAHPDLEGADLPNDAAVRREAMFALPDIARDAIPKDGDKQGYMILVTDEEGTPVYSATLSYSGVWLRTPN